LCLRGLFNDEDKSDFIKLEYTRFISRTSGTSLLMMAAEPDHKAPEHPERLRRENRPGTTTAVRLKMAAVRSI
jgi:hypothetical protein